MTKQYCSTVLTRGDVDVDSKTPFRVIEVQRLAHIELDYPNAIKLGLAALKDMGFKFRWSRSLVAVQALSALSKTIKQIKRQPKDFYLHLGRMDEKNRAIADILNTIMVQFMHTKEIWQVILCSCHIVKLTLKHGLSEFAPCHFGTVGNLALLVFGMHKDAPLFREVTLSTQDQLGRAKISTTMYTINAFSMAWSIRMDSLQHFFYDGYIQGMQTGEIYIAMKHLHTVSLLSSQCLMTINPTHILPISSTALSFPFCWVNQLNRY